MGLISLPNEILFHLGAYLGVEDLRNLSEACGFDLDRVALCHSYVNTYGVHDVMEKLVESLCEDQQLFDTMQRLYDIDLHASQDSLIVVASECGNLFAVKYFLKRGLDIHTQFDAAVRYAAACGHQDIVQYLYDNGAEISAWNDEALRSAVDNNDLEMVSLLVKLGADIHAQDDYALRASAERGQHFLVDWLCDKGADLRACDDYALRWSIRNGHTDVVRILLSHGAVAKREMRQYAQSSGKFEVLKLICGNHRSRWRHQQQLFANNFALQVNSIQSTSIISNY
ncbi:hypothetical protein MP228_003496 [Amoeboaphelidium protococcarum]|nr:hypothetical protein MP228_003496 [Amoeboaphelidium protococcarum]